ncbi:hypothetical protein Tdes44962_MAKER02386 [Teratosphaeria destructans]|uniref:Uncharacterized protein n=1 Tax=Teratosphaeria destructans TaxID=418781 RepID=A0A9W7STQ1_9PEZI|nr:hypothetical protein Tdes44962_MAKER02386 [Teratosphaeria destructans]
MPHIQYLPLPPIAELPIDEEGIRSNRLAPFRHTPTPFPLDVPDDGSQGLPSGDEQTSPTIERVPASPAICELADPEVFALTPADSQEQPSLLGELDGECSSTARQSIELGPYSGENLELTQYGESCSPPGSPDSLSWGSESTDELAGREHSELPESTVNHTNVEEADTALQQLATIASQELKADRGLEHAGGQKRARSTSPDADGKHRFSLLRLVFDL